MDFEQYFDEFMVFALEQGYDESEINKSEVMEYYESGLSVKDAFEVYFA